MFVLAELRHVDALISRVTVSGSIKGFDIFYSITPMLMENPICRQSGHDRDTTKAGQDQHVRQIDAGHKRVMGSAESYRFPRFIRYNKGSGLLV